jgi:pimeloyl-ACP methyl ester carboxylesterase
MHYVDAGNKESPLVPVVLIHGTPVSSFIYRRFVRNQSSR